MSTNKKGWKRIGNGVKESKLTLLTQITVVEIFICDGDVMIIVITSVIFIVPVIAAIPPRIWIATVTST